jgi:hypothetical protein
MKTRQIASLRIQPDVGIHAALNVLETGSLPELRNIHRPAARSSHQPHQ